MANCAIVKNGEVINIVLWDGQSEWVPEDGEAIITDGTVCIGWSYDGNVFTAPPLPPIPQEQLIAQAEQQKSLLLSEATLKITVWQTKLLAGRTLTASESIQLNAWLDYIDELESTDTSTAPDIEWPAQPSFN